MLKVKDLLQSRRFWVAVSGVALVVGNEGLGLNLQEEQVTLVVTLLASWIVGDSINKTGSR